MQDEKDEDTVNQFKDKIVIEGSEEYDDASTGPKI